MTRKPPGRKQSQPPTPAVRDWRAPITAISVVAGLLLLTAAYLRLLGGSPPGTSIGGPWQLTRAGGQAVTNRDFRGRYLLIYFGYTSCPDVCPTTLAAIADALHRLGTRADALQPVFITVDPAHDTPAIVQTYVRNFSPRLIGLSGTTEQVQRAEREFHISTSVHADPNGYTVDHTSVLLLVGPDGRYLAPLPADDSGDVLAARLEKYLS